MTTNYHAGNTLTARIEPDWDEYRLWLNEICAEDGMPPLFDVQEKKS